MSESSGKDRRLIWVIVGIGVLPMLCIMLIILGLIFGVFN